MSGKIDLDTVWWGRITVTKLYELTVLQIDVCTVRARNRFLKVCSRGTCFTLGRWGLGLVQMIMNEFSAECVEMELRTPGLE